MATKKNEIAPNIESLRLEAIKHGKSMVVAWKKSALDFWRMGRFLSQIKEQMHAYNNSTGSTTRLVWGHFLEAFCEELGISETLGHQAVKVAQHFDTEKELVGYTITQIKRIAGVLQVPLPKPEPKPEATQEQHQATNTAPEPRPTAPPVKATDPEEEVASLCGELCRKVHETLEVVTVKSKLASTSKRPYLDEITKAIKELKQIRDMLDTD